MLDTQSPQQPAPIFAALDAVGALRISLDAMLAIEELLEPALNEPLARSVDREKLCSLLGVVNTRLFLDLQEAEASLQILKHHCPKGA